MSDRFWGVFWVDSGSVASIDIGLGAIAKLCDLPFSNAKSTKQWISDASEPWLLVMDNSDDPAMEYEKFIPNGIAGKVLITSRCEKFEHFTSDWSIKVDQLEVDDAVTLMQTTSGVADVKGMNRFEAADIAHTLNYDPLAICQAGATVKRELCSIDEYQSLFQMQNIGHSELQPMPLLSKNAGAFISFEVIASLLKESTTPVDRHAMSLLSLLPFLHVIGISRDLCHVAWAQAQSLVQGKHRSATEVRYLSEWHLRRLPSFMLLNDASEKPHHEPDMVAEAQRSRRKILSFMSWRKEKVAQPEVAKKSNTFDAVSFEQTISRLESLSLVSVDALTDTIRMHPLIHSWMRDRLMAQGEQEALISAMALLSFCIEPGIAGSASNPVLQMHVEFFLARFLEWSHNISEFAVMQSIFRMVWVYFNSESRKSLDTLLRVIEAFDWSHISEHVKTNGSEMGHLRGVILLTLGRPDDAVVALEQTVEHWKTYLKPTSSPLRDAEIALAEAYTQTGRISAAFELLKPLVRVNSDASFTTVQSRLAHFKLLTAFSDVLIKSYSSDRAVPMLESAHEFQSLHLDEGDPDRLRTEHLLGVASMKSGQLTLATNILQHVSQVRSTLLAEEHTDRLATECSLAEAFSIAGDYNRAISILKRVIHTKTKLLGEEDPSRLQSEHDLVEVLLKAGQDDEAVETLERLVEMESRVLAEDDSRRLLTQYELGTAFARVGETSKSVYLFQRIVEVENRSPRHRDYKTGSSETRLQKALKELELMEGVSASEQPPEQNSTPATLEYSAKGKGKSR